MGSESPGEWVFKLGYRLSSHSVGVWPIRLQTNHVVLILKYQVK